ncbi:DUF892 family protein [Ferruginibacter lapsinanis]|uniref:YciE/YciF ferroxidase family protein n=1 Tax=Ferruginibacter lapsinanis TaxID=563172 RepID=UPI001E3C982B|nr:DUF892 family protein [Ferruginibacter lapsinanis]UEG48864.1 DUF892 family protein [Ferruginibacter lapsinanis]
MKENTSHIINLHNLLDYDAQKFLSAEVTLKAILPEWISKANSLQLKTTFQKYLGFIQEHIQKIGQFFEVENITSASLHNRIMEAFVEEAQEKLSNCDDPAIRDACILACVQDINHFKISSYGTAAAFSKALGINKFASVFHEAEENEKQIDARLSVLAEYEINNLAKAPIALTR